MLATGIPCWLMGLALDYDVARMVSSLRLSAVTAESASQNVLWIHEIYWFAPYVLWSGGALVVVGSVLGIVGLVVAHKADHVRTSADTDPHSNT